MYDFGYTGDNIEYNMADYLDQSSFDEKFEIDIANDIIRNIHHVENKYYVPLMSGGFREMYEFAKKNMIHPEDPYFHELLNPDTLEARLNNSEVPGVIKAECREMLVDGSYRWVQYLGVSGEVRGVPKGKVFFYVYDIQNQKDRLSGRNPVAFHIAHRDQLTGLLNSEAFFIRSGELLRSNRFGEIKNWCCVSIDVQHFKIFNSWYGYEKGNYVLVRIGTVLREFEQQEAAVTGYFGRDNFGLLMPHNKERIQILYDKIKDIIFSYSNIVGFLPAFGVNLFGNSRVMNRDLFDQAGMAVEEAKKSYTNRICYYNSNTYVKKREEYEFLTDFQHALLNKEIAFYLQPQCEITTGKIVGAEALVRWIKKDGTIISPGQFVPYFEKNGFITELDKYVWEAVFRWIRKLMDKGIEPLPVSINISQIDLLSIDVADYLYCLLKRYQIPSSLVKAEITESAYAENYDSISLSISKLKEKGFMVMMDDFGSGYSSLNMLDRINVDVIKLDMAFMRKNLRLGTKEVSIVESIISMTKTLAIPLVVEGVENQEQIAFLEGLGCRYAQGYYFYRPMSVMDFEEFLRKPGMIRRDGFQKYTAEVFRSSEFLNEAVFSDTILNNILGPVAFYVQNATGEVSILRFNQQFYDCIADAEMENRRNCIQDYILTEDHPAFYRMLEEAVNNSINGGECTVRFRKSKGGVFWYHMHLFLMRDNGREKIFYGKISNATEMYQQGIAFYKHLLNNAEYSMRIDLSTGMLYEVNREDPLDEANIRSMAAEESLPLTIEKHIADPYEREKFREFFSTERLKQSHQKGIYYETFCTKFLLGSQYVPTRFSVFYIKYFPEKEGDVYVFTYKEE